MLKLAPIFKEISKDFRMGGHDGRGGYDGKLHQAFTLVMEWKAVEHLKVSRWDRKSQITTVEYMINNTRPGFLSNGEINTAGINAGTAVPPSSLRTIGDALNE